MKIKKPDFWDYKKPNFISYFLLPLTIPIILNNLFLNNKKNTNEDNVKKICIGNIYVGGTGKTPLSIKLNKIIKQLNYKTAIIKKFYNDQFDEQKLISENDKLYCIGKRKESLNAAIKDGIEVVIFDDGLQDKSINYDLKFVCFNSEKWLGNGFLIPAGPLREKIESLNKYDAVFLNGNGEDVFEQKQLIKKLKPSIEIFETYYHAINIDRLNLSEKYLIFSGIGNPDSFKKTLLKNKINIVKEINFPDHYNYSTTDINNIKLLAKKLDVKILTTKKDYIKIDRTVSNDIEFLEIDMIIRDEKTLIEFIKSKL
jgi:tetraacyldisaccharide 4'-kinase